MKVLHIEGGKRLYGGGYQVAGIIRKLPSVEHNLICDARNAITAHLPAGVAIHQRKIRGDLDVSLYRFTCETARRCQPDLIHIHSRRAAELWGSMAARHLRIPFVVSRRVDNPESRRLLHWKYNQASAIIGISRRICEVLEELGVPGERIRCIRSGVDIDEYRPQKPTNRLRREFKIPGNRRTVGMIAQFIPRKGHHDLVAAAARLGDAVPVHYLLFGRGALEEEIRATVGRLGMQDRFTFAGFRRDLPELLPELDLMVHPAHREGLGVSILQAMACAVPVIANAAGGIPEIVRHEENGLLLPPGNLLALSAAIRLVLNDETLREKLRWGGRRFAEEEGSLEATAAGNLEVYQEILSTDSDHSPT